MCGISGIYNFNNSKAVNEQELTAMRDTLVHRGPDGGANFISPNKKVGLSQRRLAIIDLSSEAACPMANEDKTIWITYNGEIYNFKPLREELIKNGHKLKTHGDTEVILHGYEEWGYDIVNRLNGMFAFVIWDENKKIVFAARDHMGIKPFYYAIQNGTFLFGSEIKAILAYPDFKKELNKVGISHYLTFSSTPSPFTLFKDIKKLPSAHYLLIDNRGKIEEKEYWNPVRNSPPLGPLGAQSAGVISNGMEPLLSENDYIEQTRNLLRGSIESQMVSDVPFGCFLSGGIDSSLNATLMSQALKKPVETFSVGYKDFGEKNEFQYSREIAKSLDAKTHEILLDESHMHDFLDQYAQYADDPNGDQACFPIFWLSKLTHESGTTVIQIGEGSDEIFAGYETYLKVLQIYGKWKQLQRIGNIAKIGLSFIPNESKRDFARRMISGDRAFWGLAIAFEDYRKRFGLLNPKFKYGLEMSSEIIENWYNEIEKLDPKADLLKQMTYLEIKHRLPEFLLARADKMTMAHSVEGRVPFLDKRLVELALNIPSDIKTKGGNTKYILKKVAEGIIPDKIIWRKKQGFGTPISEWLRNKSPISDEMVNIIMNSKLKEREILNYDYIESLINSHRNKKIDQSFKIWNLVTLSLWYDYWFD